MVKKSLLALAILVTIIAATKTSHTKAVYPAAGYANINGVNCSNCHYNNAVTQGPGNVTITIAGQTGPNYMYEADSTYTVTVTVTDTTEVRFGFEWAAITASNAQAGTITLTNSNTTYSQKYKNIDFISHHNANSTNSWSFLWKAPATSVGDITFTCSGNAANGNNAIDGDNIYTTSINLTYKAVNGVNSISTLSIPLLYYYNNSIYVRQGAISTTADEILRVYDLSGHIVYTGLLNKLANTFPINTLNNGLYIAEIVEGNNIIISKKIVKN